MVDVDVEDEPRVVTKDEAEGIALRLRRDGRLVGYVLQAFTPGAEVSADTMDAAIAQAAGVDIVRSGIEGELRASHPPARVATPSLTVAVCTRDRTERLARLLDSLEAARGAGRSIEILVVDNAPSGSETRDAVGERSSVRYVVEPLAGLDFARNRAIEETTTELLAFVDDDVTVDGGYLDALLGAFAENPDVSCVTGLVLPFAVETEAQVRFELRGGFRRGFERMRFTGPSMPGDRVFPFGAGRFGAGCNMAFRRGALVELGGFDEALDTGPPLPGGGDLDIFFRVLRSGGTLLYEPGVVVFHEHRRDLPGLRRQYRSWGEGFTAFLAKCWATPDDRAGVVATAAWWARYEAYLLARGLLGRNGMTVDLAAAEVAGGVIGVFGGYRRSQQRIDAIKRSADVTQGRS